MPTFDLIDLNWIRTTLTTANGDWQETNRKFYDGDHWQDSTGWIGPRPPLNDKSYRETIAEIERGFISKNAVKEVADRHMNGVLGLEPSWSITVRRNLDEGEAPTADEQTLIDEAEALLTDWWNDRNVQRILQKAIITSDLERRASLRLFVPRGKVVDNQIPEGPIEEQLGRIYLQHPTTAQAIVVTDEDTMEQVGVYFYLDADNKERAEVVYLDEDGSTVIRWIDPAMVDQAAMADPDDDDRLDDTGSDSDDPGPPEFVVFDLDRHLTLFEFDRDLLVTPQVIANQKLLNEALTMLQRNVALGGFLERVILNGQVPGHWEPDENDPDRVWVQDRFQVGAGTTNAIVGVEQENSEGVVTYANPSIVYRDPVKVETFVETRRNAYMTILEETQQLHAAISGDATASGESRRQAMAGFLSDLRATKSRIDEAGRWLLETALYMASAFAGTPDRYKGLRADFNTRIDPGPIPAEEMNLVMTAYDKGLLSRDTAMGRIGVEDTDLEAAKIEAEKLADLESASGIQGEGDDGIAFGDEDSGDEGGGWEWRNRTPAPSVQGRGQKSRDRRPA